MSRRRKTYMALLLAALCFIAWPAVSQTFEENILYGDEAMADMDYYSASLYYRNALELDSSSLRATYKYAESCRLFNNYREAVRNYSKVLGRDKHQRYPLIRFWLGMMQKSIGQYTAAGENFRIFLETGAVQDEYFLRKAELEVKACAHAMQVINEPLDISIEHLLDAKVNTAWSEFNAVQLGDTALLFSALRPVVTGDLESFIPNTYVSKIYLARATQAGWSRVTEFDSRINAADFHNANVAISEDQTRIFFTRGRMENNPQLRTSIWYSEYRNGRWKRPEKLDARINPDGYTTTHPALAEYPDYDVLYYVSDRPGGYGKLDVWYSILKNGRFSEPVNAGSIINTPGDEITPFYRTSTQTLYFSSDWHPGLGGFDIFSSPGALSQWATPENVGYPLNTGYNDIYFTINQTDNHGYFTSNRHGSLFIKSETCCNDIYYYEWRPEKRREIMEQIEIRDTVDLETSIKKLLPLTLYFHNDEPDPRSLATLSKRNYKATLSEYYDMKDQYKVEYARGLTGQQKTKAERDIEDFFETYVAHGFSQLKLFSQLLLLDLERGSKVKIIIKGYCSPLHTTDYNLNLAKRRISSLVNYLKEIDEGIFLPYMDGTSVSGGLLQIIEEPLGKSMASPLVSDNPNDAKNSIYSRAAAFERKIQIILYETEQKDGLLPEARFPEIHFADTLIDLGVHTQGDKVTHRFRFTNTGKSDLVISSVEVSCECTQVSWPGDPIPPGGSGSININIRTDDEEGSYAQTLTVLNNTRKGKSTLYFFIDINPADKQKK